MQEMEGKNKKSLIIFYSRKGENYTSSGIQNLEVGNTKVIAKMVQEITGGDLFEIKPKKEYPANYRECVSLAVQEIKNNERPKLQEYIENIDDYEVIYIGYPNWCGTMPMPVFSLLERLDFTGKIIKPFCTNEGSGMGRSEEDLKKICKGAKLEKGLSIKGSLVNEAREIVKEWIYCS